jgi:prophage DNA circulation protein
VATFNLTEFQASLIPASYNGVFFFVTDTTIKAGQRVADHQYPFRSQNYAEPLGRAARNYTFTGYLTGGAGDLQDQYAAMLDAIESPPPGVLVHPVFGQQNVVPVSVEFEQTKDERYVEIRFQFLEAGDVIYPSTGADTQAATINQAALAGQNTQNQFGTDMQNGGVSSPSSALQSSSTMSPSSYSTPAQATYDEAGNTAISDGSDGFVGVT